jgi:D-glycero-D-manno-heptose 1,7-bisphosphate phosphatase
MDKIPALFLDRDGVINEDYGYVHQPAETVFIPGIFDLVRCANAADFKVVVVTNQAGIGRGFYSERCFESYMKWQKSVFRYNGGRIDAVYHCPHHPINGLGAFKMNCDCRKPAPGLVMRAAFDLDIDLSRSLLVGDKPSDVACGLAAGIGRNFQFSRGPQGYRPEEYVLIHKLDELKEHIKR